MLFGQRGVTSTLSGVENPAGRLLPGHRQSDDKSVAKVHGCAGLSISRKVMGVGLRGGHVRLPPQWLTMFGSRNGTKSGLDDLLGRFRRGQRLWPGLCPSLWVIRPFLAGNINTFIWHDVTNSWFAGIKGHC